MRADRRPVPGHVAKREREEEEENSQNTLPVPPGDIRRNPNLRKGMRDSWRKCTSEAAMSMMVQRAGSKWVGSAEVRSKHQPGIPPVAILTRS